MPSLVRRLTLVVALLVAALLVVGVQSAHAVSGSWSLSTTGAYSSGSYSTSGTTFTMTGYIKDTKADGSCAYIVYRPQVRYNYTGTWHSVGWSGYEKRIEVCGSGTKKSAYAKINIWDKMNSMDKTAGDRVRMLIRVCRNVNNARDNCTEKISSSVAL